MGGKVLFTHVLLCFATLVLVSEILTEVMRLSGILLRQKVLSLKGPPAAEVDRSFCCYFCLLFINVLLVFFLQVKIFKLKILMQADTSVFLLQERS